MNDLEFVGFGLAFFAALGLVPYAIWLVGNWIARLRSRAYLRRIAKALAIPFCPNQGPFGGAGAVMGSRDGYIVAIGVPTDVYVCVSVFFQSCNEAEGLRSSVRNSHEVQTVLRVTRGKGFPGSVHLGDGFLAWHWPYRFWKPAPARIAALADALVHAVQGIATAFNTKCKVCNSEGAGLVLRDGVPDYYCEACKLQIHEKENAAAIAYDQLPSNFSMAARYGAIASFASAVVWGMYRHLVNVFFVGFGLVLFIGYLMGWAVIKGMGKINPGARLLTFTFTITSIFLGDAIALTLTVAEAKHLPPSFALAGFVATHLRELEPIGTAILSCSLALVTAGIAVLRERRPAFATNFETLRPAK